ncbi:MAG: hypothetical protein UU72_C0025G0023, partial [candidate division WWE3 bacterium GW2011_GWB1_41_6]
MSNQPRIFEPDYVTDIVPDESRELPAHDI